MLIDITLFGCVPKRYERTLSFCLTASVALLLLAVPVLMYRDYQHANRMTAAGYHKVCVQDGTTMVLVGKVPMVQPKYDCGWAK